MAGPALLMPMGPAAVGASLERESVTGEDDLVWQTLTIGAKRMLTADICELVLVDPAGAPLPPFTAGAHVTVETPSGARRRYSLASDPQETEQYVIAIKREPDGRGGSVAMVDQAQPGGRLRVAAPVNEFPLLPAPRYLLVAGGIGITPLLSMARQLMRERQCDFRLIYCTRSPEATAYLDVVCGPEFADKVILHHDEGDPARAYDFWEHFAEPDDSFVYCCGPAALMEEVKAMTGHWPVKAIHFENFKPTEPVRADDRPFLVTLAKSGQQIEVAAGRTILDALREAGYRLPSSCESGVCGTCKTRLLSGEADHRDLVLRPDERQNWIMTCVSRAQSQELVLDI